MTSICYSSDVSKAHTYFDGEVLTAALLNASVDEIIVELNDIDSDNLASNIAITTSGAVILTGGLTSSGTTALSGTLNATGTSINLGNGGSDVLTINAAGGITYTPAATWTFTAAQTVSGTWTDLGTITTADINGGTWQGTIDGNWTAASQTCADLGIVTTADINGGTIDGVTIGAGAAPTVTNLGTVTTCDINGGTIDGVTLGGASAVTLTAATGVTTFTAGGDLDIGTYELRANTFESDVATGTAPFTVASTTKVTNLGADTLDTYDTTTTASASKIPVLDASGHVVPFLETYASDWTAFASNNAYTLTHSLGTTKVLITIQAAENSDGSGWFTIIPQATPAATDGCSVYALTTTQISIRFQSNIVDIPADGTPVLRTSGYFRVLMLALE